MNQSSNPSVAEEARDANCKTATQFEELARAAPETMRDLATKNLAQTREFYERYKDQARRCAELAAFAAAPPGDLSTMRFSVSKVYDERGKMPPARVAGCQGG
jgi:hypothetical protein